MKLYKMKHSKKALAKRKERIEINRQLKKKCCELIGGKWVEPNSCYGTCLACMAGKHWLELSHEPPKGMGGTTAEYTVEGKGGRKVTLRCHKCHAEGIHHEKIITEPKPM